uniref:Uncharacterized protein n=1 Tax=virus sp. ctoYX9 TaxID=2825822 RepID=A0A8S5RNS0_9VIRU|nr:MAG TPA: protein of unknown function (DUF3961) [virus sp. ctoYX9]
MRTTSPHKRRRNRLGLRNLSKYFGIDKTEVSNRITQYIYTHEF